jgi:uncharacterized caspase-like protein
MSNLGRASFSCLIVMLTLMLDPRAGYSAEMRFALVIGNDEYKTAKLATPANDAGLVADALQAAGFTVTGARNLDQATLRESFREFLSQVSSARPDAVALVYLAGIGLQFEGENYFIPIDADITRDVDIPLQAIRISDLIQPLAALPGRVKIVILDTSRQNGFARGDQPLASGLALVDPPPSMAIAFSAAPGTVVAPEQGPYGAYATSLTEMIAAGGLSLDDIFARLRLRVSELTTGAEVPWYVSQIGGPFFMTERAADAPPPPNVTPLAEIRSKPMRDFHSVEDAYAAALERDTIDGYVQFLAIYPRSPFSRRVAAMLAVRREEIIWRHCVYANTPPAFWSYLRRYPNGPHVFDARRRLVRLGAGIDPPPSFAYLEFGVPPPPPDELGYVDRPNMMFDEPGYGPPPPPPLFFLPSRPREFSRLPPPPPPRERYFLPIPAVVAIPAFVKPPASVAVRPQPPGNGGQPNGRPTVPVSLPTAVHSGAGSGAPEKHHGPGPAISTPPQAGPPSGNRPPPPPTAFVKPSVAPQTSPGPALHKPVSPPGTTSTSIKPGLMPPPHTTGPTPTSIKPGPVPPPHTTGPTPTSIKPGPVPPPHTTGPTPTSIKPGPVSPPHTTGPSPAVVKPPPPPPHLPTSAPAMVKPPPHPPTLAPAAVKPPPHSAPPVSAAAKPGPVSSKPACPPGKTATNEGGHVVCK